MNDLEKIKNEFQESAFTFMASIQTTRIIDEDCFVRVHSQLTLLAKIFKDIEMLPKKLLNDIYVMVRILRREALYFNNKSHILINMSDKLEYIFELILKGESPEQRIPGVPRII